MADDAVIRNGNDAPFVEDEFDAGETDLYPGNLVGVNSSGQVVKHSSEGATGTGLIVDLPFDPSYEKGEDATGDGGVGERIRVAHVPVGGEVDARLAAGGDLTTAANANVTEGDILVETTTGALANHTDAETGGEPEGAVYVALESVDNSGAAAGVTNQVPIEARRVA